VSVSLSDELCRSYLDLRWHFDPAAATLAGIEVQDGRLGQYDAASVREHLAAFRAIEAGVEELAVQDAADEIDRTALLDDVRVTIFRLQHEQPHVRNPAFWLLHLAEALYGLLPADGGRVMAALARLNGVPEYLAAAERTLKRPARAFLDTALALTGPLADLVSRLAREYRHVAGNDAEALATAAVAGEAAVARFRLVLDADLSLHADEQAVAAGAEQFERLLHHQHAVTAGASELWRVLLSLEEETEATLRQLAHDATGSTDWRAALAHRFSHADPLRDPGPAAVRELGEIARFLGEHDLLTVALDGLDVAPAPAWLAPVICHAAYLPAPVTGRSPARLLLSNTAMTAGFLSPLMAEFGLPGLHLQMLHAGQQRSEIRRHLASSLLREAWGFYALEMLDEAGYWTDPSDQILVRAHVLLRILLARADIGIHTRQMSVREAAESLTARLPLEPGHALAAVRGIALEPTASIGGVIGRRELLKLRQAKAAMDRPFFSLKSFHDEVLSYGGLPIPLISWGMGVE
jgi:hypothetical protein